MLVEKLSDGPLDIVGDVHGELDALMSLLQVMGYSESGLHPEGRKLVFVGDLTDRGPDSPGVIDLVYQLVNQGLGFCVLGNHDLNLMLGAKKYDNGWFFGDEFQFKGQLIPQVLADDSTRAKTIELFQSLPLALERSELQIVHAHWDQKSIDMLRAESNVVEIFQQHVESIEAQCQKDGVDAVDRILRHQNTNPVKLLTSGPERRVAEPFEASGKTRYEERVRWWETQEDPNGKLTVFGHYSLGRDVPRMGSAVCCDYGVAKRYQERIDPDFDQTYRLRLGAVRIPERVIVFEDGTQEDLK